MTRDDVIRRAKNAGCYREDCGFAECDFDAAERFAELVASAAADRARQEYEREHCRHVVPLPDALNAMIAEAVSAEREACAADCDAAAARLQACPSSPENRAAISALERLAAAIRARGVSK